MTDMDAELSLFLQPSIDRFGHGKRRAIAGVIGPQIDWRPANVQKAFGETSGGHGGLQFAFVDTVALLACMSIKLVLAHILGNWHGSLISGFDVCSKA
jgi:hypothetical protein